MKIRVIIIIILFSSPLLIYANEDAFKKAEGFYKKGEYEKVIEIYNELLKTGNESADLYYNLGNAYYKSHKITQAIIHYERALRLAPNDDDISYNLELARKLVVDRIDELPELFYIKWYKQILRLFSSDTWATISMISFIVLLLLVSAFLYSRNITIRKITFWLSLLVLIITLCSFGFAYHQKQILINKNEAIIVTPTVTVKSAPDESGTELFILHEGTKVFIRDSLNDWREIRISDGKIGWLQKEDIEII